MSSFPKLKDLKPSKESMKLINILDDQIFNVGYDLLNTINNLYQEGIELQISTSESLTGGLIMSSLINIPTAGWAKYGCFGVYDTDAKRVFNSVRIDDVYTHTCAKEMAIGILKNSNATLGISVTGNAMPYYDDLNRLGEVFIGVATYSTNNGFPTIIYDTISINNCLYTDDIGLSIQNVCNNWLQQQPSPGKYAKYKDTAAVSRIIRNYTTYNALKFANDFIINNKSKLTTPSFIEDRKIENETVVEPCWHDNIPNEKYPMAIDEICVSSTTCDYSTNCDRVDTNEIPNEMIISSESEEESQPFDEIYSPKLIDYSDKYNYSKNIKSISQYHGGKRQKKNKTKRKKKYKSKQS